MESESERRSLLFSPDEDEDNAPLDESDLLEQERKRGWLKVDIALLPIVTSMLLISLLDRSNIGNALVAGLKTDLELSDSSYNTALCVTWISYILVSVPSTLLIKKKGAKVVLPMMVLLSGIASFSQGFATSFWSLMVSRLFLGIFEAGLFSGLVLHLSSFYPESKLQMRVAVLTSMIAFGGAFSGLLAAGIMRINAFGYEGWSWIFFIEGTVGAVIGLYALTSLPVRLEDISTLSSTERRTLLEDKNALSGPSSSISLPTQAALDGDDDEGLELAKVTMGRVIEVACRPHVMMLLFITLCSEMAETGLAYFEPDIVHQLGYTSVQAQLMSVPPFLLAFLVSVGAGHKSDKSNERGLICLLSFFVSFLGFFIYFISSIPVIQYLSLFLSLPGTISSIPALTTWLAVNVETSYEDKAIAVAFKSGFNCIGSVLSIWLFGSFGKQYEIAVGMCMMLELAAMGWCVGCWGLMRKENLRRRERGEGGFIYRL